MSRRTAGPRYETGTLERFGHSACYDYVACNATAAYDATGNVTNGNTPKVNEVTRQLVFLPPDTVVGFDRVERRMLRTTSASCSIRSRIPSSAGMRSA